MTKAFHWKPNDFINKHTDKKGKTFFFSSGRTDNMRSNSSNLFTRTDFYRNTRFIKDIVL
jgi:hypothetical protein